MARKRYVGKGRPAGGGGGGCLFVVLAAVTGMTLALWGAASAVGLA